MGDKGTTSTELLSEHTRAEIDHWLKKFPVDARRSAVLAALRSAQEQNQGWLTEPLMNAVADYLQIPRIAVYEVATFYDMFHTQPVGKHLICVCTNVSCMLCGSEDILAHLQKRLGVKPGETTADGQITVKTVECLAACDGAPMCQVDEQHYHMNLTPEKIDALIEQLRNK